MAVRSYNTDNKVNKLVTIFARYLDSFLMTPNSSIFFQILDAGSGQITNTGTNFLSPGMAKIAPYPSCHRDYFCLKHRDANGGLRRLTLTYFIAGPLACTRNQSNI